LEKSQELWMSATKYIAEIPKPDCRRNICCDLRDDQELFIVAFVPQEGEETL
jgi:hypothetical protein